MTAMVAIDHPNELCIGHSSKTSITSKEKNQHQSQIQRRERPKYVEI